ncbi:MAG: YfaZ family outer membrane protein [Gammaproteobacteria bacterium]|jgi:hypothetical protein
MKKILLILLCSMCLPAAAETLDINVGHDSFRGEWSGPLSRLLSGTSGEYDVGFLSRPEDARKIFMPHVGLLVTGDAGAPNMGLTAGLGGRVVYVHRRPIDGGSLALGGQLAARFPAANRFGFTAYGYIGPRIISFGEIDGYREYGASLDYEVIRNGAIYVGYRNINLDFDAVRKVTADTGFHGGLRLTF